MVLIDAGFTDEAFGMTRTLVDIFFTPHYIANKDTEERALRYAHFTSKTWRSGPRSSKTTGRSWRGLLTPVQRKSLLNSILRTRGQAST